MKIELYHASKYGNGAQVAEEFRKLMTTRGHTVEVHSIDDARPRELPQADLYVFGSPTRLGKPIGSIRHFLKKVDLPSGRNMLFLLPILQQNRTRRPARCPAQRS